MSIAFIDDAIGLNPDASLAPPHSSRLPPKRPLSEKRLNANRLNAQKSTGPRTRQGKQKVSQNATTHGLYSQQYDTLSPLLPTECQADFDNLEAELQNELKPKTATQTLLLRQIASLLWKLHRLNPTDRHLHYLHHQSGTDEQTPPSATFATSLLNHPSSSNPFLTLTRLEHRSQSLLLRYLKEFDRQQKHHPTIPYDPTEPPVPRQQAWPPPPPAAPTPATPVVDETDDDPAQAQLIQMINSAYDQRPTSPPTPQPSSPIGAHRCPSVANSPPENKPIQTQPKPPSTPDAISESQHFAQHPPTEIAGTNPLPPVPSPLSPSVPQSLSPFRPANILPSPPPPTPDTILDMPRTSPPARLKQYRQKRNFEKTPEPAGTAAKAKTAKKTKTLFFCVQKHLASHLHYDFRLEHDGVLLSWAVPKGPSLNPKDKRLAMRVEDHPFEYGEFEGVIPEGYGAGIVMLWDKGTWRPETDDVEAAIKKGELKLTLEGVKLKGSWVLVRTGGGENQSRTWLLIKHRDQWAGEVDVTKLDKSVKSFGDFEDILAEKKPAMWESHRPAKGGAAGKMLSEIIERAAMKKAKGEKNVAPRKSRTKT